MATTLIHLIQVTSDCQDKHTACSRHPVLGGWRTGAPQILPEAHGKFLLSDGSLCYGKQHQLVYPEPRDNPEDEKYFPEGLQLGYELFCRDRIFF